MKDKILSRLKAKLKDSGVNLSQKRMDAIADKLTPKISKEEDIDAKLEEYDEVFSFADIAKNDDRLRTLDKKEKEEAKAKAEKEKVEADKGDDDEDDEPAEKPKPKKKKEDPAVEMLKKLFEEVQALKSEKTQATIKEKLDAKLKEKKLPTYISKHIKVEKEEDIDQIVEQLEEDHLAEQQATNDTALGTSKKPAGAKGGEKAPTKEEIDKILI